MEKTQIGVDVVRLTLAPRDADQLQAVAREIAAGLLDLHVHINLLLGAGEMSKAKPTRFAALPGVLLVYYTVRAPGQASNLGDIMSVRGTVQDHSEIKAILVANAQPILTLPILLRQAALLLGAQETALLTDNLYTDEIKGAGGTGRVVAGTTLVSGIQMERSPEPQFFSVRWLHDHAAARMAGDRLRARVQDA